MFKALMGGGRSSSDARSSSGSKSSRRKTGSRSSASSTVSRKSSRGDDRDRGLGDLSAYPSSSHSRSKRYAESAAEESVASSYATAQPNYSDDRVVIERTPESRRDRDREGARSERDDSRDRDSRRREQERAHSGDSYLPPLATGAVPAPMTSAPYGVAIPTSQDPSHSPFPITSTPGQMDAPSPSIYDPHVQQQFPGQFQNSTEPYRPPNPAGEAADYYDDQGQSVAEQPGVRPKPPLVIPNSQAHLMTASPSANPPPEPSSVGSVGAAAAYYTGETGADAQHSEQPISGSGSRPPKPSQPSHSSAQAGVLGATAGAAAATYGLGHFSAEQVLTESPSTYGIPVSTSANIPLHSQAYSQPQWQAQPQPHSQSHSHGVGAAVGAAAAGAAAGYMLSHHNHHSSSSSDHVSQYTMQNPDDISQIGPGYSGPSANPALYAAGIAGAAGLPYAASPLHPHHAAVHHGSPFQAGGMAFHQRQRGPLDKFVDFWRDPEGVGKFEDYTEAIGVCKYCFEPGTTSKDAPRPHQYRRRRSSDRFSAGSRVEKLSRYTSSEDEGRRRKSSKSSWLPAILGGYAVKSLFDGKDFDDSYSVKSGRVVGAYPDSESNSTLSDKRSKTSRGVYKRPNRSRSRERAGRVEYPEQQAPGHEGPRISARPRSRSRSRSRSSSRSNRHTLRDAAIGAAIGTAAVSAVKSHHRSGSHSRSRSRSPRRSRRRKSSSSESSFVDISKNGKKAAGGFGSFFTSSSANKKRRSKRSRSIFSFTNSSSSSLDNDLAFGSGFAKKLKGKAKRRSSKEKKEKNVDAKLLALGATATALAASSPGRSRRTGEILVGNGSRSGRSDYTSSASNDDGWEDMDSDGQASSVSSGLAFGASGHFARDESHSSDSSSSGWGWGWGAKSKKKKSKRRSSSANHFPTGVALAAGTAGALGTAALASGYHRDNKAPSSSTGSLQHVAPMPTSDPSRFEAVPISSFPPPQPQLIRPGPIPLQQPQPVTPVSQAVYTSQEAPIAPFNPPIIPVMESPFPSYEVQSRDAATAVSEPQWRPQPAPYSTPFNNIPPAGRRHNRSDSTPVLHTEPLETASGFTSKRTSTAKDQPSVQFDLTREQEDKERRAERLEQLKRGLDRDLERQNRIQLIDREESVQPRDGGYRAELYKDREPERDLEREREREREREHEREREKEREREMRYSKDAEFEQMKDSSSWAGPIAAGVIGAAVASTVLSGKSSHDDASETSESRRERRRAERRRATDPTSVSSVPPPLVSSQSDFTVRPRARDVIEERSSSASPPHHYKTSAFRGVGRKKSVYDDYATFFYPEELRNSPDSHSRKESPVMPTIIEIEPASESKCKTKIEQFNDPPIDFKGLDRLPWPVPELRVIEPTPPHSTSGSVRDASSPIITPAEPPVVKEKEPERPTGSRVSWGEHQTHEYEVPSTSSERSSLDLDEGRLHSVGEEFRDTPIGYTYTAPSAHENEDMTEEIEFAATVAAAAQAAGFDPSLITEDPIFRTRTSPPGSDTRERSISPSTRAPPPPAQFHGFVEGEVETPQTPKDQLFRDGPIFTDPEPAVPESLVEKTRDIEAWAPVVDPATKPVWSDAGTMIRDLPTEVTEAKEIQDKPTTESPRKDSESPEEEFFMPGGFESEEVPKKIKRRSTSPAPEYVPTSNVSYSAPEEIPPLQRSATDPVDYDIDDAPESTVGDGDASDGKKKKRRKRRSKRDSGDFDDNASVTSSVLTESSEKRKSTDDKGKKSGGFLSSIFGSRVSEPVESKRSPEKLVSREVQSEIGTRSSEESSRRRRHRSSSRGDSLDGRRRYDDDDLYREDSLADKENINVESYKSSRQRREDRRRQRYGDLGGLGEMMEYDKEPRTSQENDRDQSFLVERPEMPATDNAGDYDGASGPSSSMDVERMDLWLGSIPRRPRSHSTSPPSSQKFVTDSAPRSISPGPSWERGEDGMSRPRRPSDLRFADSPTAVPLHFRPPPSSPRLQRSPSITSPTVPSPSSPSQGRRSRPNSSEFTTSREIRPLFLVERHGASKIDNQLDEPLPSLPSSKSASSEDLTALPDEHAWEPQEYSRGFHDALQPQDYYGHEVGSHHTTPTRAAFNLPRHLSRKDELGYEFHSPSELLQDLSAYPDLPPSPGILPSVEGSALWVKEDDGLERDLESLPPLPVSRPSTPEDKNFPEVEQTTPTKPMQLPTTNIPGLHEGPGFAGVVDAAVAAAVTSYHLEPTNTEAPYPDRDMLAKSQYHDAEDEDAVRTVTGNDVPALADISPSRTPTGNKDHSGPFDFGAVVDAALAAKGVTGTGTDDERAPSVTDTTEDEFFDATGSPAVTISRDEFEFVNAEDARGYEGGPGAETPTTVTGDVFEDVLESRRASEVEPAPEQERALKFEQEVETVKAEELPVAEPQPVVTPVEGPEVTEKPAEPLPEAPVEPLVEKPVEAPAEEPSEPSSSSSKKKNKKKKKKGKSVDLGDEGEEKSLETSVAEAVPDPETQPELPTAAFSDELKKDEESVFPSEPEAGREIVPVVITEEATVPTEDSLVAERDVVIEDDQLPREILTTATDPEALPFEGHAPQPDTPADVDDKRLEDVDASPIAEFSTPDEALRSEVPEVPSTEELAAAEENLLPPTEEATVPASETAAQETKGERIEPTPVADIEPSPSQEPEEPASDAGLSKKAKKKKKKKAAAAAAAAAVALDDSVEKHESPAEPQTKDVTESAEKGSVVAEEDNGPTEATESTRALQNTTTSVTEQEPPLSDEAALVADALPEDSVERPVELTELLESGAPKSSEATQEPWVEAVSMAEHVIQDVGEDPQVKKDQHLTATNDTQLPVDESQRLEEPAVPTEEPSAELEVTETAVEEPKVETGPKDEAAASEPLAENQPHTIAQEPADTVSLPVEPEQQEQALSTPADIIPLPVQAEVSEPKPEEEGAEPDTEASEPYLSRKASKKKKKNKRKSPAEPEPEVETQPGAVEPQTESLPLEEVELLPQAGPVSVEDEPKLEETNDVSDVKDIPAETEKLEEAAPAPAAVAVDDAKPILVEKDSNPQALEETPTETAAHEPAHEVTDEIQGADQPAKVEETPEEMAEKQPKKKSKKKKNRKSTLVSEPESEPEAQPELEPETKPEQSVSTTEEAAAPPETSGQAAQPQPLDDSEQQPQEQQEDAGTADIQVIAAPLEKGHDAPSQSVENAETNDSEPHVPEQPTVEPEAGEPSSSTGKKSKKKKNKKHSVSVPAEESSIPDVVATPEEPAPEPETNVAEEPAPDAVAEPDAETPVALEEPLTVEPIIQEPAEEMSRDVDVAAESGEAPIPDQPVEQAETEVEPESAPSMTAAQKKKAKKDKKKKRQSLATEEPGAEALPSEPVVEQEAPNVLVETPIQEGESAEPENEQRDVAPAVEETTEPVAEQIEIGVPEAVVELVTEEKLEEVQKSARDQAQEEAKDEPDIASETKVTEALEDPLSEIQPSPKEQNVSESQTSAATRTTLSGAEATREISIPSDGVHLKVDENPTDEQFKDEPSLAVEPAAVELPEDIQEQKPEEALAIAESVPETPTEETQPTSSKKDKKKKKKKRQSVSVDEPEPEITVTQGVEPAETPAEHPASDTAIVPNESAETPSEHPASDPTIVPNEPAETQAERVADSVEVSQEIEEAAQPLVTPEVTSEVATEEQSFVPLDEDVRELPTQTEPEQPSVDQRDVTPIPDDQETPKDSMSEEPAAAPESSEPQQQEQEQPAEEPQITSSKKKNKKKKKKSQSSSLDEELLTPTAEELVSSEPTKSITETPVTAEPEEVAPEESAAPTVEETQPADAGSTEPVSESLVLEDKEPEVQDASPAEEVQTASSKKKAKKDKKKRKSVSFVAEEPSESAQPPELAEAVDITETPVSDTPEEPAALLDQPITRFEQPDEQKPAQPVLTDVRTLEADQKELSKEAPTMEEVATETPSDEQPKDEPEASEAKEESVISAEPEQIEVVKDISEANQTEASSEPGVTEPSTPAEPATEAAESEVESPKSKKAKEKKKRKTLELKEDEPTVLPEESKPAESSGSNVLDLSEAPTADPDTKQVEEPIVEEPVAVPAPEPEKQDDEPKSAKAKKKAKKEKKRQSKLLAAASEPSTPTEEKPEEPATPAEPTEEQGPDTQIPAETAISPAEDDGKDNQSHDTGFNADTDKDLTWTDHDVSSQVEQQQTASTEPEREREGVDEPVEETIVQVQPEVVQESQQPSPELEASGGVVGEETEDKFVENEVIPSVEVGQAGDDQAGEGATLETEVTVETETVSEKDAQPVVPEVAEAVEAPVGAAKLEEPASQPASELALEAEPSEPAAETEKSEPALLTGKLSKKQKKKQRQAQKPAAEEEQAAEALEDDSEKLAESISAEEQPAEPVIPDETQDKTIVSDEAIANQQVPDIISEHDMKLDEAAVETATYNPPTSDVAKDGAPVPEILQEQVTEASPEEKQVLAESSPIVESSDAFAADVAEGSVPSAFDPPLQDQTIEFQPTEPEPVVIRKGEVGKVKSEEVAVEPTREDEPVAVPEPPVHVDETATQEEPAAFEAPKENVAPPSHHQEEPFSGSSKKKKKKNKKKAAAQIDEATEEAPVTAPEPDVQAEVVEELPKDEGPEPVPVSLEASEQEIKPEAAREIEAEPFEPEATESNPLDIHDEQEHPMIISEVVENVSPAPILETIPIDSIGQEDQPETTKKIEQVPQVQNAEPALEAETTKEEQPALPAEPASETQFEEKTVEAPTPVEEPTLSRKHSKKQKKKAKKQAKEQLEESAAPFAAEAETAVDDAVAGADIKVEDVTNAEDVPAVEQEFAREIVETKEKDDLSGPGEAEAELGVPEQDFAQKRLAEEKTAEEVVEAQEKDEPTEALPLLVNTRKELDFPQEVLVQEQTERTANLEAPKEDLAAVPSVALEDTEKEPIEETKVDEVTEAGMERNALEEEPTENEIAPGAAEPVTEEPAGVEREIPAEPQPEPEAAPLSRKLSKKEKRKLKQQAEADAALVEEQKQEHVESAKDISIPQAAWEVFGEQERELPLGTTQETLALSGAPEIEMKEQEVEIPVEPVQETPVQRSLEESIDTEPLKQEEFPLSRKLSKKEKKKKKRKESKVEEPLESELISEPANLPEQTIDKSLEPGEVQEARHDDDAWPPIDWAKGKIDAIEQSSQSSDEAHAGRFEPEIPEFKESAIPEALMERPGETPQEAAKESRAQPITGTIERDVTTRDFNAKSTESALQALHDVESSSEKSESKPSKIANIFPKLERGFFRRPSPTQSVKDGAEDETMEEAIRDSAIQVLEAPIAREVEMPFDLRDTGYIPSPALAQDDVFGISTTRELSSTKIEIPAAPPVVAEPGSRSIEATQEAVTPCDIRRSPSIHGCLEQQGLPWSFEEAAQAGSKRDLSPPRPLHLITEQEPERSVARDGTPRLEIKPEHILPRPETPVRKFTETALGRRAWPTPDNSDDDWEKIEKPSPRLSPDRGVRPGILKTPEQDKPVLRPSGSASARSSSHSLRRVVHSASGDLRAAALAATVATTTALPIASEAPEEERQSRPRTAQPQAPAVSRSPTDLNVERIASSSSYDPVTDKGKQPVRSMTDVYEGWGETPSSPRSPSRPPSIRHRRSMQHLQELEFRLDHLIAENRELAAARDAAESKLRSASLARRKSDQALNTRDADLRDREADLDQLKQSVEWFQKEVARLNEENTGLTTANAALIATHTHELQSVRQSSTLEVEQLRSQNERLSGDLHERIKLEIETALAQKNAELRRLREELESARDKVKELQQQISASMNDNVIAFRGEDYFEAACQKLCGHVQQWVLRFSKHSDHRRCRRLIEVQDEKVADRFDNAILDGSDSDAYLSDRVRRRDVFMSVVMTMVWEFIFTRYLFGMDREQRQKLKSLEKQLIEVGPRNAIHRWRATTLSLLARRPAFTKQRENDTEAVALEIFDTLSRLLPPPTQVESQLLDSLRKLLRVAVNLSIEMRTQLAEFIMLPPLQPEYDTNGDLARQVFFNAALMNERSGETSSNDELQAQNAVVRVVLFPLVVKKGNDAGEGDEELVVCPAQVLVARPGKERRLNKMTSGDRMSVEASRSVHSIAPSTMDMSMNMSMSNVI